MRTLIAIVNARGRKIWRDAVRSTWLPSVPLDKADVFFFVGRGDAISDKTGVVELDCDDSYWGLPDKVREITRWAYARRYDFVLKCDDDVVLIPNLLLNSSYDSREYTGRINRQPTKERPYAVPIGFNYWLSRQCMSLIKDEAVPTAHNDDELWVAGILHRHGIHVTDDRRYRLHTGQFFERSTKRPIRPLQKSVEHRMDSVSGEFSWCVYLESGAINNLPAKDKVEQFMMLYERYVLRGNECQKQS